MKKAISALALTVALVTMSFGAAEAADCKVGVAMYTLSAPYFAAQVAAAVDEAKKAGCEASQSDAQNDMNKQIADVEDMVAKGVNVLILNARDPEGLVPAADAATKAGVKVVAMDSAMNQKAHIITQVRSSNDQNGFMVGEWLAKQMQGKPIKMILLSGEQGNEVPIVHVDETWRSEELHEVLRRESDDPHTGHSSMTLTNIDRSDPDPALFQVPPDYTVEEEN